jgi:hypothetical protein
MIYLTGGHLLNKEIFATLAKESGVDPNKFTGASLSGPYTLTTFANGGRYERTDSENGIKLQIYRDNQNWWYIAVIEYANVDFNETIFFSRGNVRPELLTNWTQDNQLEWGQLFTTPGLIANIPASIKNKAKTYNVDSQKEIPFDVDPNSSYIITIKIKPINGSSSMTDEITESDVVYFHGWQINSSVCDNYENALDFTYRITEVVSKNSEGWTIKLQNTMFTNPTFMCPVEVIQKFGYVTIIEKAFGS